MKAVKKYATFEELKSSEEASTDPRISLKKHTEFEKVIRNIYADKVHKDATRQSTAI